MVKKCVMGEECGWPEADLWAGIFHGGKLYCVPCAQKLGLFKIAKDGKIEFCHPYGKPKQQLGTLHG